VQLERAMIVASDGNPSAINPVAVQLKRLEVAFRADADGPAGD
jgi:hypothetical protein